MATTPTHIIIKYWNDYSIASDDVKEYALMNLFLNIDNVNNLKKKAFQKKKKMKMKIDSNDYISFTKNKLERNQR